jgi:hypothetical protein
MSRLFSRKIFNVVTLLLLVVSLLISGPANKPANASSHREAPSIIFAPGCDNTDVYAFRSYEGGREGTVTLIANFIPFQEPSGGPHFYRFDPSKVYNIKVDNTGDGFEDLTFEFRFNTEFVNPNSILGQAAPNQVTGVPAPGSARIAPVAPGSGGIEPLITSLTDPDYNEPQTYEVRMVRGVRSFGTGGTVLASGLVTPPDNIGQRTTPNYEALAQQAIYPLSGGGRVFVGQRDEGFYIDVGGMFDILNLGANPPVQSSGAFGVDGLSGFNVSTVALELPLSMVTRDGGVPASPTAANAVIGVWATVESPTFRTPPTPGTDPGRPRRGGPSVQVSRLGSPLVNEVVIPLGRKDEFNASTPLTDGQYAPFIIDPQFARLLSAVFSINVPGISSANPLGPQGPIQFADVTIGGVTLTLRPLIALGIGGRVDLVAIFATGIPGATLLTDGLPHEMIRINLAVPATASGSQNRLGVLGGDLAGFPNGRRPGDDVVDIAMRAMAGGTPFTPATNVFPNNEISDGVDRNDVPYLNRFPYLGTPHSGNIPGNSPHNHHVKGSTAATPEAP